MDDNYARILQMHLKALFDRSTDHLEAGLPARREGEMWLFRAFGSQCSLSRAGIELDGRPQRGVVGILICLYARHAIGQPLRCEPWKAFREFKGSSPYQGAFATHTESPLVPHVRRLRPQAPRIRGELDGRKAPEELGGDFSFVVHPLPKIALCYLFHEADEDFPAAVTCLFSSNADAFLPLDGLADTGEYTTRRIIERIGSAPEPGSFGRPPFD